MAGKWKKFSTGLLIFVIIIRLTWYLWKNDQANNHILRHGYHTGMLQKISQGDCKYKTYEGELILRDVRHGENLTLKWEKFRFSVNDKNLAEHLEKVKGKDVVVHFRKYGKILPSRGQSPYLVDSVRLISNKEDSIRIQDSF